MPSASMPKATIHKHSKTFSREDEIGLSGQRLMTAPARDSPLSENCHKPDLGRFIAA